MTACPKPRPALLDKRERVTNTAIIDRVERAKCRERSKGRCEVIEEGILANFAGIPPVVLLKRCSRRAGENHHLKGGIGRRNRGASILAEHRLEVCSICHSDITGHVLQPVGVGREDAATVRFERAR
jgi:hypothetical protein